jgi:hypothetical protein
MLPDWVDRAAMTASLATLRIMHCIAANGRMTNGPGGRQVIAASFSNRELQHYCGLSGGSIIDGARRGVAAGWLTVRYPANPYEPALYCLPVNPPVSESSAPPVPESRTGDTPGNETTPVLKSGTGPVPESETGGESAESRISSFELRSEPDSESGSPPVPESGTYHGGGNGGGDGGDINREIKQEIYNHHHHEEGLLQKLEQQGFGDAAHFIERHGPERVEEALDFVASLRGIKNPGAFLRRVVERPGKIPEPYDPQAEMIRQHLKSWGNPRWGRAGGQAVGAVAEPAESEDDCDDDTDSASAGTTPAAT